MKNGVKWRGIKGERGVSAHGPSHTRDPGVTRRDTVVGIEGDRGSARVRAWARANGLELSIETAKNVSVGRRGEQLHEDTNVVVQAFAQEA